MTRSILATTLGLLLILAAPACTLRAGTGGAGIESGPGSGNRARPAAQTFSVDGTVSWQPIEGGFFGIVAEDGRRLLPQNLPAEFAQDGLQVRLEAETLDVATIQMWGQPVRIHRIARR